MWTSVLETRQLEEHSPARVVLWLSCSFLHPHPLGPERGLLKIHGKNGCLEDSAYGCVQLPQERG